MEIDRIMYGAEISKLNFLLENLYAVLLRDGGASHEDVPAFADEMVRQANLPGTVYGPEDDPEEIAAIRELCAHRLAMFFAGVRERISSDPDFPRPSD